MRRVFIAFGILVFLFYCWASIAYQNQVDVPRYRNVDIDLLGGVSREKWDRDDQVRFQRLMELDNKRYQLPEEAEGTVSEPLTSDQFSAYITAHPGAPVMMKMRDASQFYELLAHKYILRDSIFNPEQPLGEPLYFGGHPLNKELLDDLLARGVKTIRINGHAAPVNFQVGTSLMVALIFLTLVAALKPVVWDSFLVMLEKRKRELELGQEAERANQLEADRFVREEARRHSDLGREMQTLRMTGQREIVREAGEIVKTARDQEKEVKLAGLREIATAADAARDGLEKSIPELAKAVADAVKPGRGARWDRLEEE